MKNNYRKSSEKAYALVFVLMILLVSSIFGGYLLKRSAGLEERSQMSIEEKRLRAAVVENFNFVAQRVRSQIETAINVLPDGESFLFSNCDASNPACIYAAVSSQMAEEMGISWSVTCRGQGGGSGANSWQAVECNSDPVFPKELFIRVQQRNPDNPDELLVATGEAHYMPIPLNAYALALTNARGVNFGPGEYMGNIAINLATNTAGDPYTVKFLPTETDPIRFHGVVTINDYGNEDAVEFPAPPLDLSVEAAGYRSSSDLNQIEPAFDSAIDAAILAVEGTDKLIEGSPAGFFPDFSGEAPVPGPEIYTVLGTLPGVSKVEVLLGAPNGVGSCTTRASVREIYRQPWLVELPVDAAAPPAGFEFAADAHPQAGFCQSRPDLCDNSGACVHHDLPGAADKVCAIALSREQIVMAEAALEEGSVIRLHQEKVEINALYPSDHVASGCGTPYAVVAEQGYFEAKVGYKHYPGPRGGFQPAGNHPIKAAFVSRGASASGAVTKGAVHFSETAKASNGHELRTIRNGVNPAPTDSPTLEFDATIVALGDDRPAVSFDPFLTQTVDSSLSSLGEFKSKGGQIAAVASDYRMVYQSPANLAGQIAAGFDKVTHSFALNESPILEAQEFAANLAASIKNFSIEVSTPRESLVGVISWNEEPVMNFNLEVNKDNWLDFRLQDDSIPLNQVGGGSVIVGGGGRGPATVRP